MEAFWPLDHGWAILGGFWGVAEGLTSLLLLQWPSKAPIVPFWGVAAAARFGSSGARAGRGSGSFDEGEPVRIGFPGSGRTMVSNVSNLDIRAERRGEVVVRRECVASGGATVSCATAALSWSSTWLTSSSMRASFTAEVSMGTSWAGEVSTSTSGTDGSSTQVSPELADSVLLAMRSGSGFSCKSQKPWGDCGNWGSTHSMALRLDCWPRVSFGGSLALLND